MTGELLFYQSSMCA